VRNGVGLLEIATFSRYEVSGADAAAWLDRMLVNRMPREGRMTLSPMLNDEGKLIGDFTVARVGANRFIVFGSGIAEQYHLRWFESHLPATGVAIRSLRDDLLGFAIAGPASRELLGRIASADVSAAGLPFLAFRSIDVGMSRAWVGRISFTGELGFEIWVPAEAQCALYDRLLGAGTDLGLRHFGARALNSLRLEKSFGNWAREYRPIYTPTEAGLNRFVDAGKQDFIGRGAVTADRERAPGRRLVTLVVDAGDADAMGDEPVWHESKVVGWVTSGGCGHCVNRSIALAYIPAPLAEHTDGFEVEILGERRPAQRVAHAIYDPSGQRMRA
jgi:dimethylglycine dehydrogenase